VIELLDRPKLHANVGERYYFTHSTAAHAAGKVGTAILAWDELEAKRASLAASFHRRPPVRLQGLGYL
jgi:hypothetical protein